MESVAKESSPPPSDVPAVRLVSFNPVNTIDPDSFDWRSVTSGYSGRALITRLLSISSRIVKDTSLQSHQHLALAREAALRAIPLLKENTWDYKSYFTAVRHVRSSLNPQSSSTNATDEPMDIDTIGDSDTGSEEQGRPDMTWVERVRELENEERANINVRLSGYMSNLIKESIRIEYRAMADLALKTGDFPAALKAYTSMREYSSGPSHHLELGLAIIEAAISFNEIASMAGHIAKVEAALDRLHPPQTQAQQVNAQMTQQQVLQNRDAAQRSAAVRGSVSVKLRVARGLLGLHGYDYAKAARELGEANEEGLGEWDGKVVSTSDVVLITALCALASGSRAEIRRTLLDRASFHASLGDQQGWVIDLVRAFIDAHYRTALDILGKAYPQLVLNPFLAPHLRQLVSRIHTRAIQQYMLPFSTVRISAMAETFGTDEDKMLHDVCQLAETGGLSVRIDLIDRVLTIKERDPRAEAFARATEVGRQTSAMTQAAILHMRLVEADVFVGHKARTDDTLNIPSVQRTESALYALAAQ